MDIQGLRNIVRSILKEEIAEENVVIHAKKYVGGTWNALLQDTFEDLFNDVGVRRIDARRDESGSYIKVILNNGDSIRGQTMMNPMSGFVSINGKFKKDLNGPEAIRLVVSMRKAWEEYSRS